MERTSRGRLFGGLLGLVALAGTAFVGIAAAPAGAAEFGPITDVATLRDVIENDATNAGGDTVILGAGITFTLTCADGGSLEHIPATPLTIVGNGATIELEPGCDDGVLVHGTALVDPSPVLRLESFTIRGGNITAGGDGGGLLSNTNTELVDMTFVDNHVAPGSSSGGAVDVDGGDLLVERSVFTGNSASGAGGAIQADAEIRVVDSTISDNQSGLGGGGTGGAIWASAGPTTVINSTISGNSSGAGVGGGLAFEGALTLLNATVTGNSATVAGGGLSADDETDTLTLVYSTIVGNNAPQGANISAGLIESFGTVVAQPGAGGENCLAIPTTTSNGYNLDDDGSCGFGAGPGDRSDFSGALLLGPLADNGGPTQTMLPEPTSPLVDAIPIAACQDDGAAGITTDQRGLPRPALGGCDIGSVEVQPEPPPPAPAPEPLVLVPRFTG